jgi:hypothetical protein
MSIDVQAYEFDREHPEVYRELVRLTKMWRKAGNDRIGIATLWERLRWESHFKKRAPGYKLNNNYKAYYARKIMLLNPSLEGVFETRKLRA